MCAVLVKFLESLFFFEKIYKYFFSLTLALSTRKRRILLEHVQFDHSPDKTDQNQLTYTDTVPKHSKSTLNNTKWLL